jgi:WD40 repeat protein
VHLRDRSTVRLLASFATGQAGGQVQVDWSPTDPILATTASDLSVLLWDVSDPRSPTVQARSQVGGLANKAGDFPRFSPDGRTLVVANAGPLTGQGTVTFIDPADGHVLREVPLQHVPDVAFSPDSETIAVSGAQAALIDVASGETIATRANEPVSTVAFANGGKWLVTARFPDKSLPLSLLGQDTIPAAAPSTTVQLWDAKTLRPLGEPITVAGRLVCCARANPDGTKYVTGQFVDPNDPDVATAAVLWELDPKRWAELACEIAGRNLTKDEWSYYLPGRDSHATCDRWPTAA